jgi:hypothetical protein
MGISRVFIVFLFGPLLLLFGINLIYRAIYAGYLKRRVENHSLGRQDCRRMPSPGMFLLIEIAAALGLVLVLAGFSAVLQSRSVDPQHGMPSVMFGEMDKNDTLLKNYTAEDELPMFEREERDVNGMHFVSYSSWRNEGMDLFVLEGYICAQYTGEQAYSDCGITFTVVPGPQSRVNSSEIIQSAENERWFYFRVPLVAVPGDNIDTAVKTEFDCRFYETTPQRDDKGEAMVKKPVDVHAEFEYPFTFLS